VLDAVARTLRLDQAEREHLYHLAEVPYAPDPEGQAQTVSPEVQGIIDAMDPLPAVVYNARYDLLALNSAYETLFPSLAIAPRAERNALWQLFSHPGCCSMFINRANELPLMVGTLRGAYGRHVGEPAWEDFIHRLLGHSEEFARMWRSGDVAPPGSRIKLVRHASVGDLRLISTSLVIQGAPESRVVVYTPSDEQSRVFLDRLRAIDDLRIGCPRHARHVSEILAERAAATEVDTRAETKDPASL
jgi:hypothetical protein